MIFDKKAWKRFMEGYMVRDCTIGFEDGRLGFLLFEELDADAHMEDGFQIRLLAVRLNNPMDTRYFWLSANDLSIGGQLSSAWAPRDTEFVAVGTTKVVYGYKPKTYKDREDNIPFTVRKLAPDAFAQFGCAIYKTVRVGATVFALGTPYRIFERTGPQQWKEHSGIPIPADLGSPDEDRFEAAIDQCAFNDLAGTSEEDMVAVGQAGVVWRYRAGNWTQVPFPDRQDLCTVAVAPDGTAYVTDIRGCVWRGRDGQWECIVREDTMFPYQDSAWFNGKLYCANDTFGCRVLQGSKMVAAHQARRDPLPARTAGHAHRLDVSPDGRQMLIAGSHGATLYDGKGWTLLFDGEPDE